MESLSTMPVLVVHDASETGLAIRTAVKRIIGELHGDGLTVLEADGYSAANPDRCAGLGLKTLAGQMHSFLSRFDTASMQEAISLHLPEPAQTPAQAFAALVNGKTELVPFAELDGRVSAVRACCIRPASRW